MTPERIAELRGMIRRESIYENAGELTEALDALVEAEARAASAEGDTALLRQYGQALGIDETTAALVLDAVQERAIALARAKP